MPTWALVYPAVLTAAGGCHPPCLCFCRRGALCAGFGSHVLSFSNCMREINMGAWRELAVQMSKFFFSFSFQLLRNVWRKLSSTRLLCYLPYKWLLGLQEAAASRSEQQGCVPGATSNDFQTDRSICDMGTPGHGCTGMHRWRLYLALKGALLATTLGSHCLTSS